MKITRRQLLASASAVALAFGAPTMLALAAPAVTDVWMETPDVLAFSVDDGSILPGNILSLTAPDDAPYGRWILRNNPRSGKMEYCVVIGGSKRHLRFEDQVSLTFVDRSALRHLGNYSVEGGSPPLQITALYYRDDANGQGETGHQKILLVTMRHTIYLQLASRPVKGVTYTVRHSTGALSNFNFLFDDKETRAGGIKTSAGGHRPDDAFKCAYLCARLPTGPNHGVVDFENTYDLNTFYIIDENGHSVFRGLIRLRRQWNQLEFGDGYTTGIDVADLSQSWTVTAVTRGNPTVVTCPGHPFVDGDKVRFRGMSGMRQLEGIGAAGAPLWVAATVSVIDSTSFSVNVDSRKFSGLTTTEYDQSLGGVLNQVYKCFNTNRAATSVWGLDYSSFRPSSPGQFRIYIPEYGVSDPIPIHEEAWGVVAAKQHEGLYNLRLGCELTSSPAFVRDVALKDGINGCANYWSTLPAIFSSEFSSNSFGPDTKSGYGAYAKGARVGPGFITNKRAEGGRPAHQDAGDNDDIGADHLPSIIALAWTFHELSHRSRNLPFVVQISRTLLDPKLFAGTDDLPPLFHEIAWHLEAYRTQQNSDGSAPGGWGLGHLSSQIPDYPEPIQYYRGTDAGGVYAGQTVMAFVYASDHYTNMLIASAFAKFSQIAYGYQLNELGDAYKKAAMKAYIWSDEILTNIRAKDAYYIGQLNIKTKMDWDESTYHATMEKVDRATATAKRDACGMFYRLLGRGAGEKPFGEFIESNLGSIPGTIGGWDYIKTPGSSPRVKQYFLAHAYDGVTTESYLSEKTCFNSMASGTSGGTTLVNPLKLILAHLATREQRKEHAAQATTYLKSLQAGLGFMLGANQPGKAFMTGFGPRPYRCLLHEDSYKMGVPPPPGITPFGYFAWATGAIVFNFAAGPNCDGPLNWIADNVSGNWEKGPYLGSTKMENPWRFGSGYWEWAPENKGLIFQSEFSLSTQVNSLIASLYLHGWDDKSEAH